jgi:RNA polymerase sigma-70 factor (ECF subfamily)
MEPDRRAGPRSVEEERVLVNEMRAGREIAFDMFMDSYVPALYRFAGRRLAGDRELTKDIVQSTVCRVIQNLDGWRAEAPLFTWLCACCANEIASHFRRRGRRPREVELLDGVDAPEADPTGRIESAELVHLALDRIAPGYARVLEWRYVEGLGVADVARRAGTTYKAAESLLSRARDAFRAACDELSGTGPRVAGSAELLEEEAAP